MANNLIVEDLSTSKRANNLLVNDQVREMRAAGKDIYHLAFGESPFPIPVCMQDALKTNAGHGEYLPVEGLSEFCLEVSKFHRHFEGVEVDPKSLVTAPGTKELIFLTMRVFNGPVILISPGWSTYAPQVNLAGRRLQVVDTTADTQWKVQPQVLDAYLIQYCSQDENKLLVLNNPGNPSGTVYSPAELKSLVEVFRKHKVIVLSDEIYSQTAWVNFEPLMKHYPEGTITTNGFSKWASAGGWRIGYAIIPEELAPIREAVRAAGTHTFSCAPAPMQFACAEALKNQKELSEYFRITTGIYQHAADFCVRELRAVGVSVVNGDGGYYLFPDFEVCRKGLNAAGMYTGQDMCQAILEQVSVCLLPGSSFLGKQDDLTTRFCFMEIDGEASIEWVRNGRRLDEEFNEKGMPRLVEAVKRLQTFVKKYTIQN